MWLVVVQTSSCLSSCSDERVHPRVHPRVYVSARLAHVRLSRAGRGWRRRRSAGAEAALGNGAKTKYSVTERER